MHVWGLVVDCIEETCIFVTKHILLCLIRHWQIVKSWPSTIVSRTQEIQEISLWEWNHETQRLRHNSLIIKYNAAVVWIGLLATDGLHLGFRVNRISLLHFPYSGGLKMPPADTCDYPAATWYWNTISIMVAKLCGQITLILFFLCSCHTLKSARHKRLHETKITHL